MTLRNRATAILASGLLALVGVAAIPAGVSAQTSYPLICKGGGGMQAAVRASGDMRLSFAAGTAGGGATPPSAGQCTWLDRGFRSGEPTVLSIRGDRSGLMYLLNGMMGGDTFFAHVYNNGSGLMVVTRVGP